MAETVRLVLNRTSESPHVLHREDCSTIQHQVRGDIRQELPSGGFQVLESYEDGLALVGPNEGTERFYYDAYYVTIEDLPRIGRYRRCKICVPDAPDGPPAAQVTRKKGATLAATDIGRVTVDGVIERVEHTASGTVVTLESGNVITLRDGETVAFPKRATRTEGSNPLVSE
ncbi:hypothetical protein [Microbacterium sp.]|uniref:hypothetical protein n=1 Tax=Microbacterium sp. TaxID=51671 RepID=UPI0027377443|nr:hypothetical protein [Microbacterium sp.]MDP3952983.1 hypothetical protein [Microbacterium sp.]